MRASEFLTEKEDFSTVPALKKEITNQVKQVQDFDVLDRIYQVLSHQSNKSKIKKAFAAGLKDSNIGSVEGVINDMMSQVANLPGTTKQKLDFITALEKGKAVNIQALMKPTSAFSEIFFSKFAQDFFVSIANYGRGASMKGPGEFALAIMSPKIALADKGDIKIGNKLIEVKAAVGTGGRGGRMGETGDAAHREEILNAITKVGNKYLKEPHQIKMLDKFLDKKSLALAAAVRGLHMMYDGNKTAVKNTVAAVVSLTFGKQVGNLVGTAAAQDETGVAAELAYMKGNFEWYKRKDGFSHILAMAFSTGKVFSGPDESSVFNSLNVNKKSITLNITKPKAVELAKEVIKRELSRNG